MGDFIPNGGGIAGLARLVISEANQVFVYFFRKERSGFVNWAGNPDKAMRVDKNSGKVTKEIILNDKKPEYQIDEFEGFLYYKANNSTINAYNLK